MRLTRWLKLGPWESLAFGVSFQCPGGGFGVFMVAAELVGRTGGRDATQLYGLLPLWPLMLMAPCPYGPLPLWPLVLVAPCPYGPVAVRPRTSSMIPVYHIHLTLARMRQWGGPESVAPPGEALDGRCGGL